MALLAGLVTYAAFPPVNPWWSAPIEVGAFILLIRSRRFWAGTGLGLLCGFGLFTPLLHSTMVGIGNPIGWIALALFESLCLAAPDEAWSLMSSLLLLQGAAQRRRLARRMPAGTASILFFAVLQSGMEELRPVWPLSGFPFGRLAFAMAGAPVLPATAYVGSAGVGLLMALAAACLVRTARSIYECRAMVVLVCAAIAVAALVTPRTSPLETRTENSTVRVGAVQDSAATDFKDAFNRALEMTDDHAKTAKQLATDVGPGSLDMIIWPENSADLDPRDYPVSASIVDDVAQAVQAPVLVGTVPVVDDIHYDDALIWNPGDVSSETAHPYYHKHRPVPSAEYIPSRSLVRRLTTRVDRVGIDMLPGTGSSVLMVPVVTQGRDVTFAMDICFEVACDDAPRTGVKQGGQAVITPTNDASLLNSDEATQQLVQGRVQAMAHGRGVIQASAVGCTATINPRSEVEQVTRPYTQTSLVTDIPLRSLQAVADRLGTAPSIILLANTRLPVGAGILSRLHSGRRAAATTGGRRRRR